jgi:hypothetical protein
MGALLVGRVLTPTTIFQMIEYHRDSEDGFEIILENAEAKSLHKRYEKCLLESSLSTKFKISKKSSKGLTYITLGYYNDQDEVFAFFFDNSFMYLLLEKGNENFKNSKIVLKNSSKSTIPVNLKIEVLSNTSFNDFVWVNKVSISKDDIKLED